MCIRDRLGILLGLLGNWVVKRARSIGVENTNFHVLFEVLIPFLIYLAVSYTHLDVYKRQDIGEWISEDAKKGALEAGAWMADHPEALFEMTERDRKCRTAYIRELKTGRPPKEPPEG